LEKAITVSEKDENALHTVRTGLLIAFAVALLSRLWTLWIDRNEKHAAGRQSSMLISLVVAFVLYFIGSFLTLGA